MGFIGNIGNIGNTVEGLGNSLSGLGSNIGSTILSAIGGAGTSIVNMYIGSKSEIDIYFESELGSIKIPVNPSDLTIPYKYANKTEEIVALGEVNVLGNPKLADITIESYFPKQGLLQFINGQGINYPPEYFFGFFKDTADNKKIMKMTVTRLDISMLVSIESIERKNEAGDHDDIYYTLKIKEFKPFGAVKLDFEKDKNGNIKTADDGSWIVKSQNVVKQNDDMLTGEKVIPSEVKSTEDNLATASKKYTGKFDNWKDIYQANKDTLGDGLGDYIGYSLKIPSNITTALKNNTDWRM